VKDSISVGILVFPELLQVVAADKIYRQAGGGCFPDNLFRVE
jgi:hypothetical protein